MKSFLTSLCLTALLTVGVIAQPIHTYGPFTHNDTLVLAGPASILNGELVLTPAGETSTASAAWCPMPVVTRNLVTCFTFRISERAGQRDVEGLDGADGIALVLTTQPSYPGRWGGAIGYDGIANGIAIELDTYLNGPEDGINDPDGHHVSIQGMGEWGTLSAAQRYSAAWASAPQLEDTLWHQLGVAYRNDTLAVWLDGEPIVAAPAILPDSIFIGLTSATGVSTERHAIGALSIGSGPCRIDTVRDTIETVRLIRDTITHTVYDTVPRIQYVPQPYPVYFHDTIRVAIPCPPRMPILVVVHDTIRYDGPFITWDTIYVDSCRPRESWPDPLDTMCGGSVRRMIPIGSTFGIRSVAPNPSSGMALVIYELGDLADYQLDLYTVNGLLVRTLAGGLGSPGRQTVSIDCTDLEQGRYFIVLATESAQDHAWLDVMR